MHSAQKSRKFFETIVYKKYCSKTSCGRVEISFKNTWQKFLFKVPRTLARNSYLKTQAATRLFLRRLKYLFPKRKAKCFRSEGQELVKLKFFQKKFQPKHSFGHVNNSVQSTMKNIFAHKSEEKLQNYNVFLINFNQNIFWTGRSITKIQLFPKNWKTTPNFFCDTPLITSIELKIDK